jgi:hypothetical protein
MELIEQKFQQEGAERHRDHKPSEREGQQHESGRPPVEATQALAPSPRLIPHGMSEAV